jgi:galactonate dehydratase
MAEVYYMHLMPHCAIGPVAFSACLHLDACIPNFLIQEQGDGCLGDGLLKQEWRVKNGYIELPTQPGLGIEIDETEASLRFEGNFELDTWFHDDDGSVADW